MSATWKYHSSSSSPPPLTIFFFSGSVYPLVTGYLLPTRQKLHLLSLVTPAHSLLGQHHTPQEAAGPKLQCCCKHSHKRDLTCKVWGGVKFATKFRCTLQVNAESFMEKENAAGKLLFFFCAFKWDKQLYFFRFWILNHLESTTTYLRHSGTYWWCSQLLSIAINL